MFWQVKVAAAVLLAALSFYMGKTWEKSIWQARELAWQKQINEQRKEAEKVAYEYELQIGKLRSEAKDIVREVYVEVSKPVYQCNLPADGLRVINKAVTSANSSKP
jgi:hypothetical protein